MGVTDTKCANAFHLAAILMKAKNSSEKKKP